MTRIELACAARRDYLPHAATMIHSVLERCSPDPVRVHFLHGEDVSTRILRKLEGMVDGGGGELNPIYVPAASVSGLKTTSFLPPSHWYRIFLPEILGETDRVLYLDGDTLALRDLRELWETDISGHYLAAVTNVFQREEEKNQATRLGVSPERYFNSGVMLLNLELWRRDEVSSALREYALRHPDKLGWPDQDAMNAVLGHKRLDLHPKWNCMNSILLFERSADVFGRKAVEEARSEPAIRHFEGPGINKPWHYECQRDMRDIYRRHRRRTPWPWYVPEGLTAKAAINSLRRRGARTA